MEVEQVAPERPCAAFHLFEHTSMKHIEYRDLAGGAGLVGIGAFVSAYAGTHYTVGEPSRMGPGFFPVALGILLACLGLVIAALAFRKVTHVLQPPPFRPRAVGAVLVSVAAFALLVNRAGLMPATFVLVLIAAFGGAEYKIKRTVLLGIALAVLAWLVFTIGLQMQLPAFTLAD